MKADAKKRKRTSSVSQKNSESTHDHSPPVSSPLRNFANDKDHAHVQSRSSVLGLLAEEESKKDVLWFCLERIPHIHRGHRVFTDKESRGFSALQIAFKEG